MMKGGFCGKNCVRHARTLCRGKGREYMPPLRRNRSSYYSRLLRSFVVISMAGILLLALLLSVFFLRQVNEMTGSYNQQLIRGTRIEIQKMVEWVEGMAAQLRLNRSVNRWLRTPARPDYRDLGDILALLGEICAASEFLDSIYLLYPHLDLSVTSFGLYDYSRFIDRGWEEALEEGPGDMLWLESRDIHHTRMDTVPVRVISLAMELPVYRGGYTGYMVFNVRESFVRERLQSAMIGLDSLLVVAGRNGGFICGSRRREELPPGWYEAVLGEAGGGASELLTAIDGRFAVISAQPSDVNGWTFITYTPVGRMIGNYLMVLAAIAAISLAAMLLCFFLSRLFSREAYRPVEQLLRRTREDEAAPDGAARRYVEFRQISESLDSMLREKNDLEERLREMIPSLREKLFSELLHHKLAAGDVTEEHLEFLGIRMPPGLCFTVCVLRFDDRHEYIRLNSREQRLLDILSIKEYITERYQRENTFAFAADNGPKQIDIVLGLEDNARLMEEVFSMCGDISRYVEQSIGFTVTIAVGSQVPDICELYASHDQAEEALEYRSVYGKNQILLYRNIRERIKPGYINPITYEKPLLSALRTANAPAAEQVLGEVREALCSNMYKMDSVRHVYSSIVNIAFIAAEELPPGALPGERNLRRAINEIYARDSLDGIHRTASELCAGIAGCFENKRSQRAKQIATDARRYLESNYDRDIGLTDLSNTLLYTPAYINKILRAETGQTFYDLLTEIRVERAKDLLLTGLQIGEVSEKVGYPNVQSFIRMFKKVTGMTPGRYRERESVPR